MKQNMTTKADVIGFREREHADQQLDREVADDAHADHAGEHRGEDRVNNVARLEEDVRAGLDALQHEGGHDDGGGAGAGNAHGEERHHGAADRGGGGRLRRDDALGDAGAELAPALAVLALEAVADERGDGGAGAGNDADEEADHRVRG